MESWASSKSPTPAFASRDGRVRDSSSEAVRVFEAIDAGGGDAENQFGCHARTAGTLQ